jgi:dihydroorotate dehydrogenase electron transfer subunit
VSGAVPLRVDAEVLENRGEGGANFRLVLRVPGWPGAEPGQFAMLSAGARTGVHRFDPLLPRPMAVYRTRSGADGPEVEVLYKVTGRGTGLLAETLPGQRVRVVGPLGRPFPEPRPGAAALLVGGGTGIASLFALAERARERSRVVVLLGARTEAELMGLEDFASLGVELRVATEDGSRGRAGRVTALLEEALSDGDATVFACGPNAMMARCAELAAEARVPCMVSLENHMACGFGVCLGCAAPRGDQGYALVCREGPVFEAEAIRWDGLA